MLHLWSFTGFSIHLECLNAFRFGQSNKFWKNSWKIFWASKFECCENVLGTSRINLPGTSLERQIRTSLGRPQDVRSGRPQDGQIGSLGDVLGTLEGVVLGMSWGPILSGWKGSGWEWPEVDEFGKRWWEWVREARI